MAAHLKNIPVLDGWVNLTEAAEILGISRQHAYKKAKLTSEGKRGGWKSVRQLGDKSFYVVSTEELAELLNARKPIDDD